LEYNPQIRALREAKGMTVRELANKLYVTAPAVVQWESGRNRPTLDNLLAMADLFGCSIDTICGRDAPGQTLA